MLQSYYVINLLRNLMKEVEPQHKEKVQIRVPFSPCWSSSQTMLLLTLGKQIAGYASSKAELIQNQQKITVQDLQPWQAMCKFLHIKGRGTLFRERKRKLRGSTKQTFSGFSFSERAGVFLLLIGITYVCLKAWKLFLVTQLYLMWG